MKARKFWIILFSILLFVSICINVLLVHQLTILGKIESSYANSNHNLVILQSLRDLSRGRFVIYSISEEEDSEQKIGNWTIDVYSLKKIPDYFEGHEGLNNYMHHNNLIALKSACHLLLMNQKEIGLKVIEVLSEVSPWLVYDRPKRKPVGISVIKQAAKIYSENNQSHETIRDLAFQWQCIASDREWVLSDELRKGIWLGPAIKVEPKDRQK